MAHPGLAVSDSLTADNFPGAACPRSQTNGPGDGSVGEEEADSRVTRHWLAPSTEVTADVAVEISQPQCH